MRKILIISLSLISCFYFYYAFTKGGLFTKVFNKKCSFHRTELEFDKLSNEFETLSEKWESSIKNPVNMNYYLKMKKLEKDLFGLEPCIEKISKELENVGITDFKDESQRVKCLLMDKHITCYKKATKRMKKYL